MKIERIKENGYVIDIIDDGKIYEAWISAENIGIKMLMFGMDKSNTTGKQFREMAADLYTDYIEAYRKTTEEDEEE